MHDDGGGEVRRAAARATDTVRADATASSVLSRDAADALHTRRAQSAHEARLAGLLSLIGAGIAAGCLAGAAGALPRLPSWSAVVPLAAALYEVGVAVSRVNTVRDVDEALERRPFRAWARPVRVQRRRGVAETWLLVYTTGKQSPPAPAPFAAVMATAEWPVQAPVLLVDVVGIPSTDRTLTVFDAATGQVLGIGPVASTARTVELMLKA